MSCSGDKCETLGDTEVKHDPKTGNIPNSLIYVIITSVIVGIAVCIAIAVCKMKKNKRVPLQQVRVETEEDDLQPNVKSKRGYGLNEERLDSDFEDECEEIPLDTEKPTL